MQTVNYWGNDTDGRRPYELNQGDEVTELHKSIFFNERK